MPSTASKFRCFKRNYRSCCQMLMYAPPMPGAEHSVLPTRGLPLIGQVPGLYNCFAVMAFGGNGITWSRLGAEMIHNFITGKKEPDEDLFRFHKK